MNRRFALGWLTAGAAVIGGLRTRPARAQSAAPLPGAVLVAYLTRSGNTAVFAGALARRLDADIHRIQVADPYPADYEAHVARAQRERDAEARPELAETKDISRYGTVILGFPVWGGALPAPIRSFLSSHDLSGKTLVPVVTHGGYGTGSSLRTLSALAPDADQRDPFVLECDQERRQLGELDDWFTSIAG